MTIDVKAAERARKPFRHAWIGGDQGWRGNFYRAMSDYLWARRLGRGPSSVARGLLWAARRMI